MEEIENLDQDQDVMRPFLFLLVEEDLNQNSIKQKTDYKLDYEKYIQLSIGIAHDTIVSRFCKAGHTGFAKIPCKWKRTESLC